MGQVKMAQSKIAQTMTAQTKARFSLLKLALSGTL